jgi:hypothetical protein
LATDVPGEINISFGPAEFEGQLATDVPGEINISFKSTFWLKPILCDLFSD